MGGLLALAPADRHRHEASLPPLRDHLELDVGPRVVNQVDIPLAAVAKLAGRSGLLQIEVDDLVEIGADLPFPLNTLPDEARMAAALILRRPSDLRAGILPIV